MRIIGGRFKGAYLARPPATITRPMRDRIRESVFNILLHSEWKEGIEGVRNAIVVDAFGGSGALSLEALSRGAKRAYVFDTSAQARAIIQRNIDHLGLKKDRVEIIAGSSCCPSSAPEAATLILLDPPFGKNLAPQALNALNQKGWISNNALIVAEISLKDRFTPPEGFTILREKTYGTAKVFFLGKNS